MIHEAIYAVHTNVVEIKETDDGGFVCKDANGNVVSVDVTATAITEKQTELQGEVDLDFLRFERNKRLEETDYWDNSDTPAMSQAQIDYRQALRDITDTYTSVDDVVWPTKP